MKQIRLSEKSIKNIDNQNICCVEKSITYLDELCERFDVLKQITCIVDANEKNYGAFEYHGRLLEVYPLEQVCKLDWSDTAILITSDYYQEYYDRIVSLLGENSAINTIYFFANRETEYELSYRKKYAKVPLDNIIVFRSGPHADAYVEGMDFADNARALFEYALSIKLNEKYELVWIVNEPGKFRSYQQHQNVSFLPFNGAVSEDDRIRNRYYKVLCLAKYFFFTDAYGFVRNCRADQIRVQLWHGCGYKKRLSAVSCAKRYEYMTVISPLYAGLHAVEFGLQNEQMLVTGCAKADWLFDVEPKRQNRLHIPAAKKYIFWLPTYRFSEPNRNKPIDGKLYEETGLPLVSQMQELWYVNECLAKNNIVMVIKIHPFQDRKAVHVKDFSNIVLLENSTLVKNDIQINQILGMADALISDYSSTAVDYLILDRPMAFCVEDIESYSKSRGYIFENILEWLPGKQLTGVLGLMDFIQEIGSGQDSTRDKRIRLRSKMHQYYDKNSCKRILETLGIV